MTKEFSSMLQGW